MYLIFLSNNFCIDFRLKLQEKPHSLEGAMLSRPLREVPPIRWSAGIAPEDYENISGV